MLKTPEYNKLIQEIMLCIPRKKVEKSNKDK